MPTPEETRHYQQLLNRRQVEIDEQVAALSDWCEPVAPDVGLGRLTRSDAMQDQQMALHNRQRLTLQQTQIKTALDRLAKGTFGVCVLCKKPLDTRRLEMVPESPLCVPCLEKRKPPR